MMKWLTNDPEAAKKFRKADREYAKAVKAAGRLDLQGKIDAIRIAREVRQTAYKEVTV